MFTKLLETFQGLTVGVQHSAIWGAVIVACAFTITCAATSYNIIEPSDEERIQALIEAGQNPVAARCAILGFYGQAGVTEDSCYKAAKAGFIDPGTYEPIP